MCYWDFSPPPIGPISDEKEDETEIPVVIEINCNPMALGFYRHWTKERALQYLNDPVEQEKSKFLWENSRKNLCEPTRTGRRVIFKQRTYERWEGVYEAGKWNR